jgi:ribokinase
VRAAVVGHVEWIEFVRVERLPVAGEIVHAVDAWDEPAGGGAVAAVQLAKLAGGATFYTALGDDELGHRAHAGLSALALDVRAAFRPEHQRRAVVHLDADGERTITVIGERLGPRGDDPLPWEELAAVDAVYFTAGDVGAVRAARAARTLVATPRGLEVLAAAHVELDALVGSGRDTGERYQPGDLDPPPHLVVRTASGAGGEWERDGERARYEAAPVPGPVRDAYGCGDSFAAGLTYGLGAGLAVGQAIELAARCGAACLTGRGPYQGQLTSAGPLG